MLRAIELLWLILFSFYRRSWAGFEIPIKYLNIFDFYIRFRVCDKLVRKLWRYFGTAKMASIKSEPCKNRFEKQLGVGGRRWRPRAPYAPLGVIEAADSPGIRTKPDFTVTKQKRNTEGAQ
jgi:hypothetical protein